MGQEVWGDEGEMGEEVGEKKGGGGIEGGRGTLGVEFI